MTSLNDDPRRDDRDKLWSLLEDMRYTMFTTCHAGGQLRARPMTTQNSRLDAADTLWFFMSRSGETAQDLAGAPAVNLGYADTDKDRYVSVAGRARLVEDAGKKRELWSTAAQAWFPGGVDDPDLALVAVEIDQAEYWNVKDSKLTQMFKMAKAAISGSPPQHMGEHGELRPRAA